MLASSNLASVSRFSCWLNPLRRDSEANNNKSLLFRLAFCSADELHPVSFSRPAAAHVSCARFPTYTGTAERSASDENLTPVVEGAQGVWDRRGDCSRHSTSWQLTTQPRLTHTHTHLIGTKMGLWRPLEARQGCEESNVQVASEVKLTMYVDDIVKPDDSYDKQAAL